MGSDTSRDSLAWAEAAIYLVKARGSGLSSRRLVRTCWVGVWRGDLPGRPFFTTGPWGPAFNRLLFPDGVH